MSMCDAQWQTDYSKTGEIGGEKLQFFLFKDRFVSTQAKATVFA